MRSLVARNAPEAVSVMTWRNDAHGLLFNKNAELNCIDRRTAARSKPAWCASSPTHSQTSPTFASSSAAAFQHFPNRPRKVPRAGGVPHRLLPRAAHRHHPRHAQQGGVHRAATLYIGSANFGSSGLHETVIGVRSPQAHAWYAAEFDHIWRRARRV